MTDTAQASKVIVVGADFHGDWAKDVYLTLREAGVDAELIFTNTVFKGTDSNSDAAKRVRLEKIKQIFRRNAKFLFNFIKEQRRLMAERALLAQIRNSHRPDRKLFVIFMWTPPSIDILKNLRKIEGVNLTLWLGEAPIREERWSTTFKYFDHFLYVDEEWFPILSEDTQKKATFLALASSPQKFFPLKEKDPKFASDVSFVGYYRDERAEVLSVLKDYDLKIYGYWWENGMEKFPWLKERYCGPLSNEDANKVFNSGKIQIGRALAFIQFGHVVTQRVFDISLAGNFQLSGYAPAVERMFGDAIPMFKDARELKEKVDYYLAHPEERKRLAAKAHAIALRDHTYAKRIQSLIKILGITV